MNKFIVIVSACMLLMGAGLSAQSIKLVKPVGGESMPLGQDVVITWSSQGLAGRVAVHVLSGTQLKGVLAENQEVNGSIAWTVGQCPVSGEPLQPGSYRIKVVSMQNTSISALSGNFTVAPAIEAQIDIELPRGGEIWTVDSQQIIRWRTQGLNRPVSLVLFRDQTPLMIIASDLSSNGEYLWTVGQGQVIDGAQIPVGRGIGLVIEAHARKGNVEAVGRSNPIKLIAKPTFAQPKKKSGERKEE